jgi:hypothetical protein
MALGAYDTVRVTGLLLKNRFVDGTAGVVRQPQIGDTGTVLHVLGAGSVAVECIDANGFTLWVADFSEDELELVQTEAENDAESERQ